MSGAASRVEVGGAPHPLAALQLALLEDHLCVRAIDDAYAQVIARAVEKRREIAGLLAIANGRPRPTRETLAQSAITGSQIRVRRQHLGLSQEDLARCANVSRGLIYGVEMGQRRNPHTLAHIERVLLALEARREALPERKESA